METEYPAEKDLDFIKNYDLSKLPVRVLVEKIEALWWNADMLIIQEEEKDDYASSDSIDSKPYKHKHITLELHCGGWSGNEDIIRALEQNKYFYAFFWESSKRGGHYTFEIQKDTWDKKVKI